MALVVFDGLVARCPPPRRANLPRATSLSGSRGAFLWGAGTGSGHPLAGGAAPTCKLPDSSGSITSL